ncbi:hypothetical protein C4F40_10765 [Sphingobacterium sp. Ka21]|uniref:YhcG N-terminal domain-containing protein n=1 Tax=Sphingobacterium pedocola TaxID=2082722 RepID=A0ABR9T7A6_9SPHI|nr:hypothetical protein [Sphingobacterium pedocola]
MSQGALAQVNHPILLPVVALIPWTHHTIILDKIKSADDRLFYIRKTAENGWTKSVLTFQIESRGWKKWRNLMCTIMHLYICFV